MPFDPNGWSVDLLRSCYSTMMRPFFDAPDEVEIVWYFVPDGTPFLPEGTLFASGNWATSREGWTGPGEVSGAPRPWADGSKPFVAPLGKPAGKPEYFLQGAPLSAAGEMGYNALNVPLPCAVPGVEGGGDWDGRLFGMIVIPYPTLLESLNIWVPALPTSLQVDLFKNDFTPDGFTVLTDFVFEDINGSPAPQVLSNPITGGGLTYPAFAIWDTVLWQALSGFIPQDSFGYVVFDPITSVVWWCERFSSPVSFQNEFDLFVLQPEFERGQFGLV